LGGLCALEWAWQSTETNLRCVRSSGLCMPNLNSLALIVSTPNLNSLAPIVSAISAFIRTDRRTDGQTDMARSTQLVSSGRTDRRTVGQTTDGHGRSTRLVILIRNILYTLWDGNASFCLLHNFRETLPSACYILSKNLVYPFTLRVTGVKIQKMTFPSELIKKCYFQAFKFNSKFLKIQKKIFSIVDG